MAFCKANKNMCSKRIFLYVLIEKRGESNMPIFASIFGTTTWVSNTLSTMDGSVGFSTTSLIVASNVNFQRLGSSGNFTVEWYQYYGSGILNNNFPLALMTSTGSVLFSARYNSDTSLRINIVGGAVNCNIPNYRGKWTHQTWCRSGTTLRYFLNGSSIFSTNSPNLSNSNANVFIGNSNVPGANFHFPGVITNVRWVSSVALYTANFIPPSSPLTEITGTLLLMKNYTPQTVLTNTANFSIDITSTGVLTHSTIKPFPFIAA